jgi:hypothetical protein
MASAEAAVVVALLSAIAPAVIFAHPRLEADVGGKLFPRRLPTPETRESSAAFIYLLRAVVGGTFLFLAFDILAGFIKVFGIVFLGQARCEDIARAKDPSLGMQLSQIVLAVSCLAFGIFPTWTVRALNGVTEGLLGTGLTRTIDNGWL